MGSGGNVGGGDWGMLIVIRVSLLFIGRVMLSNSLALWLWVILLASANEVF